MKDHLLSFLKLACFVCIFPFIAALIVAFYKHVLLCGPHISQPVCLGALFFIGSFLLLYSFKELQDFAQNAVGKLFSFAKPIAAAASQILPIYAIISAVIFLVLKNMNVFGKYEPIGLMVISFFWTMHVILVAQTLKEGEKSVVKGGYFLGFGCVLVFLVLIGALLLTLVTKDFSITNFINNTYHQTTSIYSAIYQYLFTSPT